MGADVDADNIAFFHNALLARYAVDDHIVDRNTRAGRKPAVAEKRGDRPLSLDILADDLVDFPGGNARFHRLARQL